MPRASMQGYLGALLDNNVITRVANVFTTTWQNYADRASPKVMKTMHEAVIAAARELGEIG